MTPLRVPLDFLSIYVFSNTFKKSTLKALNYNNLQGFHYFYLGCMKGKILESFLNPSVLFTFLHDLLWVVQSRCLSPCWESCSSFLILTVSFPECFPILFKKELIRMGTPRLEMREGKEKKVQKLQAIMFSRNQNILYF